MKYWALGLFILLLFFIAGDMYGQELSAAQMLDSMEAAMTAEASRATAIQTIETSSGGTREFVYESYMGDSGSSSLMRYESPARVKDEAFLMLNDADDIWAFFPRTRRTRKLASHARKKKIMGSDFTYEDMGGGKRYTREYTAQRLPDKEYKDTDCYVLELTARPDEEASYGKMICVMRKSDYYPMRIDYYEKKDELLKTLYLEDIKTIEGRPTAMKMIMHNEKDNTETVMEFKDITYDVTFDEDFFTERNLKP